MTITPPIPDWDSDPLVGICINEQWATFVSGLLAKGEAEEYWDIDQIRGAQGIRSIQEALFGICGAIPMAVTIAVLEDQKAQGTAGGSSVAGAWNIRDLNVELYDPGNIVQIGVPSANRFTLVAGTFLVLIRAPHYRGDGHKLRLWNETDGLEVKLGSNAWAANALTMQTDAWVIGIVNIPAPKAFRVEYRVQIALATFGLGLAVSFGTEVYTQVLILRLD